MVTPSYSPIVGGTETYVHQLTSKLNKAEICADVMTLNMDLKWAPKNRNEVNADDGFKVYRVSASNPWVFNFRGHTLGGELLNIHALPRLNFSAEFGEYDIIHFHDDIDLSFPFFAHLFRLKTPTLMHCHSIPYTYGKYKRNILSGTLFRKAADLYVGLSKFSVGLLQNLGLPDSKLFTLPNAVDVETFHPSGEEKIDNLVLYAARITRGKGLDVLLKALPNLDVRSRLVIIGPVGDQLFFREVERLIRKMNVETIHKIEYLGVVNVSDLARWHRQASIFVCPSISDHFPISILEAMASGTPIVASRIGAIPEMVVDEFSGLLVSENDPSALAFALKRLLENGKLRASLGNNARQTVKKYFSWDVVLRKLLRTYEELCS
jgi:glycosyltransferase involved in cell wall biosynthesis